MFKSIMIYKYVMWFKKKKKEMKSCLGMFAPGYESTIESKQ